MAMGSIPVVGGHMSSSGGYFGNQKIPTPKELVKMLDQYVVGQNRAKRVSPGSLSQQNYTNAQSASFFSPSLQILAESKLGGNAVFSR